LGTGDDLCGPVDDSLGGPKRGESVVDVVISDPRSRMAITDPSERSIAKVSSANRGFPAGARLTTPFTKTNAERRFSQ
jgi:hypothetical protein